MLGRVLLPGCDYIRIPVVLLCSFTVAYGQSSDFETPSAKDFHKELAKNFAGLISRDNIKPFVIGTLATGLAVIPEQNVESYFLVDSERLETLTEPGEFMGSANFLTPVVGGLFVVGRFSDDRRFQSMTYSLAQGYVMTGAITASIKHGIGRQRPNDKDTLSFPSGHTSTSFLWATVMSRTYGFKAAIPAYAAAVYVGATRVEDSHHHLTDVVAGATIGYIIGRTVTRRRHSGRRSGVNWMVAPVSGGFAAAVSFPGP